MNSLTTVTDLSVKRMFIGGKAIDTSDRPIKIPIQSPIHEKQIGEVYLGDANDVDAAVEAATTAFKTYGRYSVEQRIELLERFKEIYIAEHERLAQLVTTEIGSPISFSRDIHAGSTIGVLTHTIKALKSYDFTKMTDNGTAIIREPIGVCGLITPWNYPIHQIIAKVAPALAAGCTMVLKPSELSPISSDAFAEIFHRAGFPEGTLNVVHGDGPTVGAAISSHPGIDMVSFTGSTRAGVLIAQAAATTIKRVHQELGGKSAAILLDDADIDTVIPGYFFGALGNTGQACMSWSRFLVPEAKHDAVANAVKDALEALVIGDPYDDNTNLGTMSNLPQYEKVQRLIGKGIEEGATLMTGGVGRPEGLEQGYFAKPTLFANVTPDMIIAREEIFGPVLSIMPYKSVDEAIEVANSSEYGLSGAVFTNDLEKARDIASQLRTGMVHINAAFFDFDAPFGGYKQSGNGRELGRYGIEDFLEHKAVMGYADGQGVRPPH